MNTYRNNGAYRSSTVYGGLRPTNYTIDLPSKRNVKLRSAIVAPTEKTSIRVVSLGS